jgi:hypothetical protein
MSRSICALQRRGPERSCQQQAIAGRRSFPQHVAIFSRSACKSAHSSRPHQIQAAIGPCCEPERIDHWGQVMLHEPAVSFKLTEKKIRNSAAGKDKLRAATRLELFSALNAGAGKGFKSIKPAATGLMVPRCSFQARSSRWFCQHCRHAF